MQKYHIVPDDYIESPKKPDVIVSAADTPARRPQAEKHNSSDDTAVDAGHPVEYNTEMIDRVAAIMKDYDLPQQLSTATKTVEESKLMPSVSVKKKSALITFPAIKHKPLQWVKDNKEIKETKETQGRDKSIISSWSISEEPYHSENTEEARPVPWTQKIVFEERKTRARKGRKKKKGATRLDITKSENGELVSVYVT